MSETKNEVLTEATDAVVAVQQSLKHIDGAIASESKAITAIMNLSNATQAPIIASQTIIENGLQRLSTMIEARRKMASTIRLMKKAVSEEQASILTKGCPPTLGALPLI